MAEQGMKIGRTTMIVAAIILLLLVFFIFVPAYKGYKVHRALKDVGVDDNFVTDMGALATAKENAEARAAAAEENTRQAAEATTLAESAKSAAQDALTSCETQAAAEKKQCNELADSLSQEKAEVKDDLEDAENAIVDAANQLCCVQKIFTPAISGYDIDDGKVECVESGGEALSC